MQQIDPNIVAAGERGLIRLYSIELEQDRIAAFKDEVFDENDEKTWPLRDALGARFLDSDFIEVFDVAALEGIGLAGYLNIGNGVVETDIEPYRALLDGITGMVLMVVSSAFGDFEQTLTPQLPLRYIATFREEGAPMKFKSLPDESANGPIAEAPAKKTPSDAAMGGRVATIALLVMAALVWVMIKIAG